MQHFALSAISLLAGITLSALISLSELSPRVGIAFSALVSLREMFKFANPNGQKHTWLANLQFKFEDDPTVKKSGIMVLLEQVWIKLEISQFQHTLIKLHIT